MGARGLGVGLRAIGASALVAAVGSGLPSLLLTCRQRRDPTESTRAAGSMVLGDDASPCALAVAGGAAHLALSVWWTVVLAAVLPPGRRARWGAVAGLVIAGFDLGLVGRRFERIRRLPLGPQVADHLAFGLLAGWALDRIELVHGASGGAGTLRSS
jgi:hypothetical protein